MGSMKNSKSDTCSIQPSHSNFQKNYEGTEDQIADLAITLHSFLERWMEKHENYSYQMNVQCTQLTLTVKKQ